MRFAVAALCALLPSCSEGVPASPDEGFGEACGVPDLEFEIDPQRKILILKEQQVQGTVRTETGLEPFPITERQLQIEGARSCLEREASRRGLTLEYPIVHVDG